MKIIESTSDPRSEYFDLMRRESLPAEELMGRRMETGVIAVLAQLGAKPKLAPDHARVGLRRPAGDRARRAEWEYFESRGQRRVPGYAGRPI